MTAGDAVVETGPGPAGAIMAVSEAGPEALCLDAAIVKGLLAQARWRAHSTSDAQDLVQEACLAALESWKSFEGRSSVVGWLRGILRNKTHELFRRNGSVVACGLLETATAGAVGAGALPTGEEEASRHEFWAHLHRGLSRMPRGLAAAYVAAEIEELDTPVICRRLGISAGNLWVRVHRARRLLRRLLGREWRGGVS